MRNSTLIFFGLPKEQFGFSNNVIGLVGPPTFEKIDDICFKE